MDALILGHACGHNLIAISGVLAALGVAAAMKNHDVAGKVILLGTPAEENFGGKIDLIKAGAYKSMDACLMVHPAPYEGLGEMLAIAQIDVEYTGTCEDFSLGAGADQAQARTRTLRVRRGRV